MATETSRGSRFHDSTTSIPETSSAPPARIDHPHRAQLNAVLVGLGTINLGSGAGDKINLTSTSSDLDTLGAADASILGVEAISAATAGAGVTIALRSDRRLLDHRPRHADAVTGGDAADTIAAGDGDDTIDLDGGDFVAGNR